MIRSLLAVLLFAPALASAQTQAPDGGTVGSSVQSLRPAGASARDDVDEIRREMESKLEAAKKEIREEIRAQMATQSAAQAWPEEKRKLELFVPNGYFRIRPELFNKFDLGRGLDTMGYSLWPRSAVSASERTTAGINMRFRFEPTLNVSEEVRIKTQIDALDNVIFGSTPAYAFSRSDQQAFSIFSNTQVPPQAGLNSFRNSIQVKRVYGEVTTPVGILRFGRMGSHWGLGMVHNDGNCLDCDHGDTVDRVMFVAPVPPLPDFYITPMIDWNGIGLTSERVGDIGQPYPLTNSDQILSFILAIAKRDTEQQAKTKLQNGQAVFNFGIHFTYRSQKNDPASYYKQFPFQPSADRDPFQSTVGSSFYVPRRGSFYLPDFWAKYERKRFRIEIEAAALFGSFSNRALDPADANNPIRNSTLNLAQFGAVAQAEVRLLNGALHLNMEIGYASGDNSPGFGNRPGRLYNAITQRTVTEPVPGAIDGPKWCIAVSATCAKNNIRNFRFNQDYRIELILWREIIGGITDAIYVKPTISYDVTEGFRLYASIIYSRAVFAYSTPSSTNPNLGIELNAGVRYETEDGFFAQFAWGVLFPLGGFQQSPGNVVSLPSLDTAQALRGMLGIRF